MSSSIKDDKIVKIAATVLVFVIGLLAFVLIGKLVALAIFLVKIVTLGLTCWTVYIIWKKKG